MTMPRGVSWRDSSLWTRRFSPQRWMGLTLKLTGFAQISDHSRSYLEASYTITPRGTNGVLTNLPTPTRP